MVQRKRSDDGMTDDEYLGRRLLLLRAIPVAALLLGLLGASMILSRGLHPPSGPDQGVRKIAPEVPSATPHPRPCGAPGASPADYTPRPAPAVEPPAPKLLVHAHP